MSNNYDIISRNLIEIITESRYLGDIFHQLANYIRHDLANFKYSGPLPFYQSNNQESYSEIRPITIIENKGKLLGVSFKQHPYKKIYQDLGHQHTCVRRPKEKCIISKTKSSVALKLLGGMSYIEIYHLFKDIIDIEPPPKSPDYDLQISEDMVIHKKRKKSAKTIDNYLEAFNIEDYRDDLAINQDSHHFNHYFLNYLIKSIDNFCYKYDQIISERIHLLQDEQHIILLPPDKHHRDRQLVNKLFLFYPSIDATSMRVNIELFYQKQMTNDSNSASSIVKQSLFYDHVMEIIYTFNTYGSSADKAWEYKEEKISEDLFLINSMLIHSFKSILNKQIICFYERLKINDIFATRKAVNDLKRIRWLITINDKLHREGFREKLDKFILPYPSYQKEKQKPMFLLEILEKSKKSKGLNEVVENLDNSLRSHLEETKFNI